MKKYIIIVAAAIAAMACSKVENIDTPAKKITFEAASYVPQTKANVSVISEFTSFKCKAFLHAAGYTSETQTIFGDAETITPDNTTNPSVWSPSHDYYWPKDPTSYINFIAWHDAKGTAPTTATETSLSWSNYEVLADDNLLYADEAWRYKSNDNDPDYHMDSVTEGVPMLFHHALAQLCIKANVTKASEGNTSWDVTLEDISLAGVYNHGTLTLTNSDPSANQTKAWTGSWATSGQTTAIAMDDVDTPLTTSLIEVLSMQKVLPQAVTSNVVLNFKYNISYKYSGTEYAHEKITAAVNLNSITGAIANWEMNKKITYNITINPETTVIKIDPAMEDWVEVAGGSASL